MWEGGSDRTTGMTTSDWDGCTSRETLVYTSALYGFVIVLMKHVRVFCFLCHGITGQSLDLVSKGMSILIIYHVICSFFT